MQRIDPRTSAVIVVDVQEKLASAMPAARMTDLVRAASILIESATTLGARVFATEQYPQGLGPTVAALAARLSAAGVAPVAKLDFSACADAAFDRAWSTDPPRTAIVIGMETHVCVFQTVRDLCARGFDVHVPIDGVASRRDDHREAGLDLCRAAGATITTSETVAFDWLRRAGTDEFRRLSKLIR